MDLYDYVFSSSDDDEDIIRRPRQFKERRNYFVEMDDVEFKMRFRLNKETILIILYLINDEIQSRTEMYISTPIFYKKSSKNIYKKYDIFQIFLRGLCIFLFHMYCMG